MPLLLGLEEEDVISRKPTKNWVFVNIATTNHCNLFEENKTDQGRTKMRGAKNGSPRTGGGHCIQN